MFDEIPSGPLYGKDPIGNRQVQDFWHMLNLFNELLVDAQKWDREAGLAGLVGSPFDMVLGWPLCLESGRSFFANKAVDRQFKRMLGVWSALLKRPGPRVLLVDQPTTRLSEEAISISLAYSTRRPKADKDSSTATATTRESRPRALQYDIQWKGIFWLKGQPYSLDPIPVYDTNHHLEASLSGGAVYQGFGIPRHTDTVTPVCTGP